MKFKLFYFLCITISFCFSANVLLAQNLNYFIPSISPNAPNTAAFAKYGNYDVNLFSGLPDISLPLYTIESGGLKLPITLSYHASGIKVSDAASWAGLGWSINTAGSVTRAEMGLPDEQGILLGTLPNHTLDPAQEADLNELYDIVNQGTDTRPDIFSYNIPGHSGNFFFNPKNNYQIQKIPFSPVSIFWKSTFNNNQLNLSFTIKDEHGTTFLLGQNYVEKGDVRLGGTQRAFTATNAWMLEKMISANKRDTISMTYASDFLLHPDALSETCTIIDQPVIVNSFCGVAVTQAPQYAAYNLSPSISEQLLKTIYFRNGKVDFELNSNPRLDITSIYGLKDIKISIYNFAKKAYEVEKTILFYQSYFGSSSGFGFTGVNNLRLRLDSIQILDKAGSVTQHYRFGYNPMVLPNYNSLSRDWWGYYNHKQDGILANGTQSATLMPQMVVDDESGTGVYTPPLPTITIGSNIAHSRDCDSNYMQACMLDTIYYPTGGFTTFTYQTNRYLDTASNMQLAGGLRVTSINRYANSSATPITKTYQYGPGQPIFLTSGINPVNYGFFSNSSISRVWQYVDSSRIAKQVCNTYRTRTFYAQSTAPLDPIDGTPVGYTSVTEYEGTPTNNIGKTTYSYSFSYDQVSDATGSGILIYQSNFFKRGQLTDKSEWLRKADGTYQIVKDESNNYSPFVQTTYQAVGLAVGERITNTGVLTRAYTGQYSPDDGASFGAYTYSIQSADNYLKSTTTKVYDTNNPSNYTTSSVNYSYDDTTHLQVTKTSHVDSRGNTHITMTKHAYDYLSGGTTNSPVLDTMINQRMYTDIIEKWDSVKNVSTSSNSVSGAQLNQYKNGSYTGSVVPSTISTLSVSSPVTNFTPAYVNGSTHVLTGDLRYVQMISFDYYDNKNNIAYYTPRNATPTAITWDYLYENPIAQVKNTPNPSSISYAYTSFEADGKGNWTFTGAPVTDLTAPTGSKVYPLSSGSITSSYNVTKAGIISYWSNNGAATVVCSSTGVTGTPLTTVNGWTYYEHAIPAGPYSVTISGSTSIDELRMYPADAQMITYSYSPDGLTSIADTKGSVSHFEYDYAQRLRNIKDFFGNIVNNYGYHTYDQTIGNDAMSSSFTRNNCPPNTTAGSLTYWVPVNKYYSSTKASANAEATFDLNTNGQAKANQNCGCPVIMVNFTLSNSTSYTGYQATFSGISTPYNFPASGSTVIQVPQGTYTTVSVSSSSTVHTFSLTGFSDIVGHSATFNNVTINAGSNLTLSAKP